MKMKAFIGVWINMSLISGIQFKFMLPGGKVQCFGDDLPANMLIYGRVQASAPEFRFDINQVQGDREISLDQVEYEPEFDFHHVMEYTGQVSMCFEALEFSEPIKIQLQYDSGGETHDFQYIATKGQVEGFNTTIHNMEKLQIDITRDQLKIMESEGMRNTIYIDVSTKIIGFGGITFAMLLIVASCQVIYLKRYFISKKIM